MAALDTRLAFLTVDEVAQRVQQSPRTIRRKIAEGEIAAVRLGEFGPLRVSVGEYDAWLERRRI